MQKRRLGISLYPERSTFEQDVAYMEKAAKLGFDLLFIALLGAGDRQQTIDRYKPLLAKAKELGFEIEADVNPHDGLNAWASTPASSTVRWICLSSPSCRWISCVWIWA